MVYTTIKFLEQIGELLGITRERVRQLEKAILLNFRLSADGKLPHITEVRGSFDEINRYQLLELPIYRTDLWSHRLRLILLRLTSCLALSPKLTVLEENDFFYLSVGITSVNDEKTIKANVAKVIDAIKKIGKPVTIEEVAKEAKFSDNKNTEALATTSKKLATLNGKWGLIKWPLVNPKNIRDKIYVILSENGDHMHFNEIAEAIKDSEFKRKDVTTQAIHNELIKDKRFVLIGRGIYALKEWGYSKGTVADVIFDVLKKNGKPMHREEIVKEVLKSRYVKETTILLNLQGKPQFKRTAKATYTLAEI